jgi:hypothetical protein
VFFGLLSDVSRLAMPMDSCQECGGFIPAIELTCPNCSMPGHAKSSRRGLLRVGLGAAISVTLMACYGGPPRGIDRKTPDSSNLQKKISLTGDDTPTSFSSR